MVLAGALGVLLTLSVLRSADDTRAVLVAAHDLAPGSVVNDSSVRVAHVHADPSVIATLVGAEQLASLRGRVVTAIVHQGELVGRGSVAALDAHVATRVMSFPIARARARSAGNSRPAIGSTFSRSITIPVRRVTSSPTRRSSRSRVEVAARSRVLRTT
jgi:hypothetical protein